MIQVKLGLVSGAARDRERYLLLKLLQLHLLCEFLHSVFVSGPLTPAGQRPFTVNVIRENHQAVEHSNTTLTWLFPVSTDMSSASLHIHIRSVDPLRTVFLYDSPPEAEPYQDEDYRGRAWCDPELARKGRIECLLTDLRLSDTGSYQCIVAVNRDSNHKACHLNVTGKMSSLTS